MTQIMNKPVIVALDYANEREALSFVDQCDPQLCRLKVGKELFTVAGPQLVKQLVAKNFDVFLDLKFHDIPNTVASACRAAADLGVWMVNVHASGGTKMMESAREALLPFGKDRPLLIAVTILTSLSDNDLKMIGMSEGVEKQVFRLAQLTHLAGLDGVVCSAQESVMLRQALPKNFLLVTPGIRLTAERQDDQVRIVTPKQAIKNGSDYLVIGRPITQSNDPSLTLRTINSSLVND